MPAFDFHSKHQEQLTLAMLAFDFHSKHQEQLTLAMLAFDFHSKHQEQLTLAMLALISIVNTRNSITKFMYMYNFNTSALLLLPQGFKIIF
jgi:hypothetical protein